MQAYSYWVARLQLSQRELAVQRKAFHRLNRWEALFTLVAWQRLAVYKSARASALVCCQLTRCLGAAFLCWSQATVSCQHTRYRAEVLHLQAQSRLMASALTFWL
jgi:hypothetical protein